MKLLKCEILRNEKYGDNIYKMDIFSPYICNNSKPGQFINIKCSADGLIDPLLRRPICIYDVEKRFNVFSILYVIKGKGTKYLSSMGKGDMLDFTGPLGNPIEFNDTCNDYLLIGGGIGVAPLYRIAGLLNRLGRNIIFLAGFRDNNFKQWERDLVDAGIDFIVFTEDGSHGQKGLPTDYLKENLHKYHSYDIYCCGPAAMLECMQGIISDKNIRTTAILEERMACGLGVCMGCAVKMKDGESYSYKMVCKDGPAFDLKEVIFE